MKILLDTNILIHREVNCAINYDIGRLFGWLDKLQFEKCIHPLSLDEIQKHEDEKVIRALTAKLKNYYLLKNEVPESIEIRALRIKHDTCEKDNIGTSLLKEVFTKRVDYLITEDRKIQLKASELGISGFVYSIDGFLEKVSAENPGLADYKTLAVKKEYFRNININDIFFNSFKNDYQGFSEWFKSKANEISYICESDAKEILAFLYVKTESHDEEYADIEPPFEKKKRLKIGTFKVTSNGYKLGERFIKIVFDNALRHHVDEIYVTLFNKTEEHERLIGLLTDWGFIHHGKKLTPTGFELVYIKNFNPKPDQENPKITYPFIDRNRRYFIVPIYPEYHTELLPDSILNNESPKDFIENEPHRNAIQKAYVSRSFFKELRSGDIIVFYRTKTSQSSAYYSSVVTTLGIVDNVHNQIKNENDFINLCRKRSVFPDSQLREQWNYNKYKPFVVNFLYLYSFPRRPNLKQLIEMGVIAGTNSVPRGFEQISEESFNRILQASGTNESFIID